MFRKDVLKIRGRNASLEDPSVEMYEPGARSRMKEKGLIGDGEGHWIGGVSAYNQGEDYPDPETDGTENGYDSLREHLQNQKF